MKKIVPTLIAAALAACLPSLASASCGAAFCAVNSNWTAESALAEANDAFDLRFESIKQDQPMTGSRKLAVGEIKAHHDEVSTMNRNAVVRYSHSFGNGFGLEVSGAIGKREHEHIHNHHGAQIFDSWSFTELGDVRVTGRYQLLTMDDPLRPANAGITFGLKLPTGKFDLANGKGAVGERSMQPGTGTTDLILGGYYHRKLVDSDLSWFAQGQFQHALNTRENYRPGAQLGLDVGVRKGISATVGLLGQLNYVYKRADRGSEGEPDSSGGRYLYASPGLSVALPGNKQLYAFYQVPVHRHVTGIQLSADRALVIGLSGQL
ncbi:transporter [Massilia sp. CF038]|uniref:transporter n=1 Tax=Massilia sp. CF038 TaxID=1881045 RepID=UPI00091EDB81|nr:transporter [Massilia sp. CF038]SHG72452.1 Putative MetA-pathway of phenol degradation [Massilia sp. CF038]